MDLNTLNSDVKNEEKPLTEFVKPYANASSDKDDHKVVIGGFRTYLTTKKILILTAIYLLTLSFFIAYHFIEDEKWVKNINAKRAAFEKAYAEEQEKVFVENEKTSVPAQTFSSVQPEEKNRVPSTDLFLKAVQAEKGGQAQKDQPQILDYGAQVAAYEAQAKAQQQKALKPTAAQQAQPQVYTNPSPAPRQTGAAANKNPSSVIQQEKQQETKLNKLETRRIFK